ncbi:MAG: type II toxin-antitoxin system YoeB family toxin [Candidatus Nanoarchaeia archaeon]|nr:type II toxin-antitoxin system YoeB family toxin [Candidatus Nanoarchaeia archaeon]
MKNFKVQFVNEKIKEDYNKITDLTLKNNLNKAFEKIIQNPFYGIQIPKKLILKVYIKKYKIKNLWKYNLPNSWRLIYSIQSNQITILSIILEWFNHKNYERTFKY